MDKIPVCTLEQPRTGAPYSSVEFGQVRPGFRRFTKPEFQVAIWNDGFEVTRALSIGEIEMIRDWCITALAVAGDGDTRPTIAEQRDELLAAVKELLPEGWGDDDTMDHIPGVRRARLAIRKIEW